MLNSAVILAGGKSSRMGEDKALMPFGGCNSMAEYQYKRLKKIFKNVYISAKDNKFNFDAKIILDRYKQSSPMIAIASILEELQEDFFLISVDMPLLSLEAIKNLKETYYKNPGYDIYILTCNNNYEPTAAIYTKNSLSLVKKCLRNNTHKLKILLNHSNKLPIKWDNCQEFININDKKIYKYAEKLKNLT